MADRSVKVIVGANVSGLVNGMRTAKGAVEDFTNKSASSFAKNRQQLDDLAGTATKVGVGLVAIAGFAVKSAMDWEVAWTGVLKTVDGTSKQLSTLEGDLRSLAKETGFAHSEVAAVAEAAGQLGISTGGISDFTETMLALGVSTNLSAEEAATGLARFRNIMGSSESDIERMGSTIVGLGNNFATTEREIMDMAMRLAGAGRQAGLVESDVLGLAASMSSVGIEAEAGGTAMSLTLKKIGREVELGGGKLDTFARIAGMSAEDFRRSWQDDAAGTLTQFVAGLDRASQSGESVNGVLTELGITGVREADALLRLSGNAEGLADALGMAGEEWQQNAALMAEADKFYNTTAQRGKQAWTSIKDSAIDAGDALLPVVAGIFDAVGGVADAFGSLPGPVKGGLTAIAGTGGAAALAIAGLVKLAGAVQDTVGAYRDLTLAGGRAKGVIGAVGRAGAGLAVLAGVQAVGENLTKRSGSEIDKLGDDLLKFAEKGKLSGELTKTFGKDFGGTTKTLRKDIDSLGEALSNSEKWGDDNFLTRLWRRTGGQGATTGNSGIIYDQVNAIKDMDAALVKLSRNKPDDAIKSFEALRDRALDTGASADDVANAFPAMTEILRSASEQMGGTSDAAEILSGDLANLAPAAQASAEEMQKARDEAGQLAASFFEAGDALAGSLSGWESQLREQTEALRDFRKNAVEALRKGADENLVDYLLEQGPAGAAMLKKLAEAGKGARNDINDAFGDMNEETARFIAFKADLQDWKVVTEFKTKGADGAVRTAIEVANAANMTPEQVETVLSALDYASDDIDKVLAGMRAADSATANPKVTANVKGLTEVAYLQQSINRLTGKTVTVRVVRKGSTGGGITENADGGLHENGVKAFADGGWDERGNRVERTPQMRSGAQGSVVWGEAETGWEAYVSGKPSQKPRNRAILSEAASRLGGSVQWFADGGFTEAVSARELTSMRIRVRDLQRALKETEKTKRGRRHVLRGLDRLEARQELREAEAELAEQNRIRRVMKKRGWSRNTYNEDARAREAAYKTPRELREEAKENRQSVASSFADGLGSDAFKSPASLERALSNMLRDSAEFTTLLADLRKKGASPWLLDQLVKAGPSRATNRTMRKLLGDSARLNRLNLASSGIVSTANQYAALTSGSGFQVNYSGAAAFDYNALAKAMAQVQITVPITRADTGWIAQTGQAEITRRA